MIHFENRPPLVTLFFLIEHKKIKPSQQEELRTMHGSEAAFEHRITCSLREPDTRDEGRLHRREIFSTVTLDGP